MATVRVKELNKLKCIYYTFNIYFLYVYTFLKILISSENELGIF